jgi:predicted GIY-YIG superfamily endonuclease
MEKLTTLYRFYDSDNQLLYVGVTGFMPRRAQQHSKYTDWHRFASHAVLEHFETRGQALAAEADAIRSEQPKYNIQGSSQHVENEVAHYRKIAQSELTDPIHAKTSESMTKYLEMCNTGSDESDVYGWAILNALFDLWDENKIPCIPCRKIMQDDYIQAMHYRVCKDYENNLRGVSK